MGATVPPVGPRLRRCVVGMDVSSPKAWALGPLAVRCGGLVLVVVVSVCAILGEMEVVVWRRRLSRLLSGLTIMSHTCAPSNFSSWRVFRKLRDMRVVFLGEKARGSTPLWCRLSLSTFPYVF